MVDKRESEDQARQRSVLVRFSKKRIAQLISILRDRIGRDRQPHAVLEEGQEDYGNPELGRQENLDHYSRIGNCIKTYAKYCGFDEDEEYNNAWARKTYNSPKQPPVACDSRTRGVDDERGARSE